MKNANDKLKAEVGAKVADWVDGYAHENRCNHLISEFVVREMLKDIVEQMEGS